MIERVGLAATVVFGLSAAAGALWEAARGAAAVVAIAMFFGGTALMLAALVFAAGRSRTEALDVAGVFFRVPKVLLACLVAQVVIGFAAAAARPFTSLAFGVLAPVLGLGMCGLWGARHGQFRPREA